MCKDEVLLLWLLSYFFKQEARLLSPTAPACRV